MNPPYINLFAPITHLTLIAFSHVHSPTPTHYYGGEHFHVCLNKPKNNHNRHYIHFAVFHLKYFMMFIGQVSSTNPIPLIPKEGICYERCILPAK